MCATLKTRPIQRGDLYELPGTRYRNGEYEQVWDELTALGPAIREEPHYSQAREVAAETMRRVRRNCELLDDVHKDNESGGDPYGVAVPNPSADFEFLNECHKLPFVSYLRMAILRWGGLPGLDGSSAEFEPIGELVAGLEQF